MVTGCILGKGRGSGRGFLRYSKTVKPPADQPGNDPKLDKLGQTDMRPGCGLLLHPQNSQGIRKIARRYLFNE